MKGLLYKATRSCSCDDYFYSCNFFCVENAGVKLHVYQSSSDHDDESIEILGVCDGSCMPQVELSQIVECVVRDYFSPVQVSEYEFPQEFPHEPLVDKMITKINRWTKRYRWTRQRRSVSDFS